MRINSLKSKITNVLRNQRLLREGRFIICTAMDLIRLNHSLRWEKICGYFLSVAQWVSLVAHETLILIGR